MSRRDTGFPGQQSALLGNKKKFNVSSGLVKAPVSTMGGESSALKSYHSNKLGGGSKLEKIPLSNNIGEKPLYEPSKNQFLPDQSNSKLTTRRGTGFPGQDSRIPHYKTSLIKPEKEETGVVNQEVHSEVTETADNISTSNGSAMSKRRDTGMPAISEQKSFFGDTKKPKVHGPNSNTQTRLSSTDARKNIMPKIAENVQHYRRSEWMRVKTKTIEAENSNDKIQEKSTIEKLKSAAVSGRKSMFSASRRVVNRISLSIFSEAAPEGKPGKMTAEDDLQLKEYTMGEVKEHNTDSSSWVVIHGRVYDVTKWMWFHPGMEEVLQQNAGKDATNKFENVFHSNFARDETKKYVIGKVKGEELGDLHAGVNVKPEHEPLYTGLSGRMTIFVGILAVIILRTLIIYYNN